MTLLSKQMAGDRRVHHPCSVSPSARHIYSLQTPSLRFLVAITAIVGTGSGPLGAVAQVQPEFNSVEDKPCAPTCQGECFAGKCLFTGDELALSGSPSQPSIVGSAAVHSNSNDAVLSVPPESVPSDSLQSAPVRNHGRLRRHGMKRAPATHPVATPMTPVQAVAPSNVAASHTAGPIGVADAQHPRQMYAPFTAMQVGVQPHLAMDSKRMTSANDNLIGATTAAGPALASQRTEAPPLLLQRAVAAAVPPQEQPAPVVSSQLQQAKVASLRGANVTREHDALPQQQQQPQQLRQRPDPLVLPPLQQVGPQQQIGLLDQPVQQGLVQQFSTQEGVHASEQMLQATLTYEQQLEAALRAENGQLRGELARWREAGARVAQREAKVVETITELTRGVPGPRSETTDDSAALKGAPRQSLLSMTIERYVFNGGKTPLEDSVNSRRLVLIFFAVNALAFLLWVLTARKGVGSPPRLLEAMLRHAGLGSYTMEVSELQVRNLCICGEAHLSLRMGPETEVRIEAAESMEGDMVRFDGVFSFKVHASHPEGNCVVWVMDRDPLSEEERIAHLEVPMREILSLAQREHGEYVTFDLEPHGPQAKRRSLGTQTTKPCLAMRLRDVTTAPYHKKIMKSGSPSSRQVYSDVTLSPQRRLQEIVEPQ